jgi:hypothetical protein
MSNNTKEENLLWINMLCVRKEAKKTSNFQILTTMDAY